MVTVLLVIVIVLTLVVAGLIYFNAAIKYQLEMLDREQHTQNNEIAVLMRNHLKHQEMLLQHIEILKYLVEQDPKLNSGKKMYFTGPVGEA